MYKKHLLHFWLTVAALLLSAVALVAELNGVNFFTFISGFSEWHYIPFAVVTLCVAFIVLVMEWRAIAGQLRIKEVSLASIEFEHPYVPRREQIALVGLLTLVYLAFLPPISVKMYAASADILSSVTGSTDSMPSGTGSDVATVSGSTAASESSLVTGSGAATDAVTGGASADSSVSSSGSSVTDIGSVTGSTLSGNTLVSSASSGEQTSEVASESSGAADSSESSVAFSQSSSSEVPFAQGQLVLHTRDGVNAFEATAMPSFTLVNINLDSTPNILNTDGTLKTTVALQEIVKSVVTDDTIKSAVVQAAIADSQQEIAREVTTDSISVTTMRDVSGGDERHLRDDILTEKVREVVSNNAIVQDQLTDSIRSNNAVEKLLDASVTDTMKQAIVDSVVSQAMQTGDPLLTQTSSVNAAVLGAVEQNSADLLSAVAGEVVNTVSTSDSAKAIIANSVADTARKPVTGTAADATISLISVALTSGNGTVSHPKFHFAKGSVVLVLEPISRFTPGMYTLAVSITNPLTGETTTQTQNFAWGVLAMNTNQDRYRPGDIAQLNMGVLDDAGNMVCDAALALDITEPDGNVLHVSTADQSIEQHQSCSAKVAGVTEPDFSAFMTMTQSGTYVMRLTAETPNGTRTISSHVQVTPDAPFIVTRKAATRLYPVGGSPMQVTVDFLQDFHGTVTDFVPDGFNILGSNPQATVQPFTDADGNTETSVAWQGSWPAGSSVTYTYIYDAPDISPQFYLVGPLMLDGPQAGDAQYEARQWQIANDAPATDSLVGYLKFDETSAGSTTIDAGGDGNNGTLNGASGANNKPQPSSDVPTMSFTDVRSLNFDGTDDYVSAGTTGVPTGTASRTIAGWIKPNVSATVRVPFVYGNCVSAGQAFGFYLDASNIINFWGCSAADFSTGVSVTSGTWTHVAITYDGTNVKVFKNGVQAGSTTARTLATTSNFWQIGAGSLLDPSNYFFPGYVDDVRVYSRALTATELTDLAAGNHIQAQWVGGTSANFELAANWSINSVPDPYSRLKIVGAINNPVMTRAESGAGLIITATGSLDFAGQKFTMNDAGTVSNAGTIRILGSETLTGFTNDSANGTVLVYGTGSTYTGLPTGSNYNNLTLDTGLVGYWKMDEGVGTVAKDSSRNGNNGVLINGPAWSGSSLPTTRFYNNKSLKFDGLDDYVEVPASSRLTGFSAFTVSMWVKWRTFGGSFPILIAKGDDTNREYLLYAWQSTNRLSFEVYNPSSQILNVDNVVSTGSWLHIAATFKGGTTQELYVNGVRVGSRTPSSGNVRDLSKKLAIGREGESSLYYTNGNIDDVRVYSRALSALEISTLAAGNPASGSGKVILSSNLLVNGNLSLYNSALDVSASNYSVTVKGNIQNTGNFVKQSGLVVLGGTGNQTISGSTIFNNFTATGSSARKLFLDYTSRQSASGALTLRGLTANLLSIRSTRFGSGARVLLDGDSGTQTIDYLDVKDSIATGGAALVCYTNSEGCVDSGNNFNWNIAAQTSSISGRLYGNTGATLGLASKTVAVSLNGQTAVGTTTTDANGNFTITGITQTTLTGGTVVALYVDNNTEKAVTVSHGSGGSMTGMTLIRDTLVIQSGTGGTALGRPVTSNELAFANNVDTDITSVYTDSSTNITVVTGKRMEVRQGGVASLGGTLTTSFLHMNTLSGSLIQGSNSITVNTALTQSGGTFVGGSQTINMVGNFTLGGGRFISTSSGMIVSGDFIHPTAGIFSHNSGTMIFAGGLSATMDVAGTEIFNNFTANKSNLLTIASGDTAQVNGLFSWLTNRILLGTINAKGDVSITGASHGSNGSPSTVQLSGSSTQTCTISAGAGITGLTISNPLATCTLIGAGTVSIFSALTVAGGTFNAGSTNLLVGTMTISSGTFNAPSSTLSISFGWTHTAGTFNHNNGTVSLVTSGTRTFSVPGNEIFYNLTMAGASDASTANMTAGNTFTVLNTFAHTNGILNTGQLRLKGNTVIQSGSDGGSALLQFTGTGTQLLTNIGGIVTTGNWTVAKPSGVLTLSGGALSLNTSGQDLIMTGGTLNLNGNNLTVNRTFTVGTGTTLKLKGTETITGGPDFIHKGAIIYYTEPSQTLRLKNFTPNYQNLVLGSTGSAIFRPFQNMSLSGSLTISGGTLQFDGGQSLTISGSYLRTGGAFTSGTGTMILLTNGQAKTLNETSAFNNLAIDDGLVGYWKMDEGVGTVAKDLSRNGSNGVLTNGPAWSGSSLPTTRFFNSKTLNFDGVDDMVNISDTSSVFGGMKAVTISAWIYPRTTGGSSFGRVITKNDVSQFGIVYNPNSAGNVAGLYVGAVSPQITASAPLNTWTHVAFTWNGSTITSYSNGVSAGSFANTTVLAADTNPLVIGNRSAGARTWNGFIDDVRIYNRALNASEINALSTGNPATGSGKLTLGSTLTLNGNLGLYGSTLDVSSSNYNISLKGNLQNSGDFIRRSGTVNLTGTTAQTISGSTIWNNLAKTVSTAQNLFLDYTSRQSASGSLTLRGLTANLLSLRSTRSGSGAGILLDGDSGTQTIDYLDVKDSIATGGATLVCYINTEGCVDSGNNFNWTLAAQTKSISGKAYSNTGATTPLAGRTIAVSLNGQAAAGTAATDAGGQFAITGISQTALTGGTIVSLYIDGATEKAVTVSHGSGGSMTGMTLIKDTLVIQSGTGGTRLGNPVTSTDLDIANNNADTDITAVYTNSSQNITVVAGKRLEMRQGGVYTLGGTLTTSFLHMNALSGSLIQNANAITVNNNYTQSGGTFNGGSSTMTISNNYIVSAGVFNAGTTLTTGGTSNIWNVSGGSWNARGGTLIFTGNQTVISGTVTYNNLTFNAGASTVSLPGGTFTINGTLTVSAGLLNSGTLNAKGDINIVALGNGAGGGSTSLLVNGTGSQLLQAHSGRTTGDFLPFTINKTAGTLTLSGTIRSGASWTYTQGTLNPGASTVVFVPNAQTITGTNTLNNVVFDSNSSSTATIFMAAGSTVTALSSLTVQNSSTGNISINTGTIEARGNILYGAQAGGGTATVKMTGTGTQILSSKGGTPIAGTWTIAKTSGMVTLSGALSLNTASQNLILTGGTLNLNGNNLTVNNIFTVGTGTTLRLKGTETITGGPDFIHKGAIVYYTEPSQALRLKNFTPNYQNIVLGSTGAGIFRPSRQGMTMSGSLTISGGTLQFDGGQSLTISGSYLRTGGAFTSGTGTIVLLTNGQQKTLNETSAFNNLTIDDGLIGYWKFDEGQGLFTKNSAVTGSGGYLRSGPTWSGSSLPTMKYYNNKSMKFDGVDDYVDIGNPAAIKSLNTLTVSAWVRPGATTRGDIVGQWDPASVRHFALLGGVASGKFQFFVSTTGNDTPSSGVSSTTFTIGNWYHVTGVYDGSRIYIYVNGVLENSAAQAGPLYAGSAASVFIGKSITAATNFNGNLDDVRIYNRALNPSEINALAKGNPATGSGRLTLGSALTVNNNLGIYGSTLDVSPSNYTLNLAGSLLNSGDFIKRSGTVNLTGTSTQVLSGSTIFNNLTKTSSASPTLNFDYSARQSVSGALVLQGNGSSLMFIRSTRNGSGAKLILDNDAGTQTIDHLSVKDSDASGGQTLVCYTNTESCGDVGNNVNWTFTDIPKTIVGRVYANTGGTIGLASKTVAVSLNGATAAATTTSDTNGNFSLSVPYLSLTGGTIISLYLDNNTEKAVTVSHGSGGSMTGMTLIKDTLVIQSGTGGTRLGNPVTSNDLDIANNNADTDITGIYTNSSSNITVVAGKRMEVRQGGVASLGGTLTTSFLHMNALSGSLIQGANAITVNAQYTQSGGTFRGGSSTMDLNGPFILGSGIFTATSGSMTIGRADTGNIFIVNAGTFTHNSGTVVFDTESNGATESIDVPGTLTFNNLSIAPSGDTTAVIGIASADTLIVNGTFSWSQGNIDGGTIRARGDVTVGGSADGQLSTPSALILDGSGTQVCTLNGSVSILQISNSSATCTVSASSIFTTESGTTLTSGTFNGASIQNSFYSLAITGGNFTATTNITIVTNQWIHTAGTFNHNFGSVQFQGSFSIIDVPTTENFYNLSINLTNPGSRTIPAGDRIIVLNTFDLRDGQLVGLAEAKGDVIIWNATGDIFDGGTGQIQFTGTGSQIFEHEGGSALAPSGLVTIAKASGTVTLSGALSLNTASQNLILTGGTLNLNGNNLTVNNIFTVGTGTTLKLKGTETITGGPDFIHKGAIVYYTEPSQALRLQNFTPNYQNIVLGSTGAGIFRPSRQGMTMSGSLTISGGTLQFDGGQSLTISGSYLRTGGAFTSGTGTMILLTNGQAKTLNETSAFNNLTIDDGLVGYWKFDEGVGAVAKDSSRSGNNGALTNSPVWSGGTLPATRFYNNKALAFNGSNSYVTAAVPQLVTNTYSVCFYAKDTSVANSILNYSFSFGGASFRHSIWLGGSFGGDSQIASNSIGLYDGTNVASAVSGTFTAASDQNVWRHICITYDKDAATRTRIYKDGVAQAMFTNAVTGGVPSYSAVRFGIRADNFGPYKGLLDDMRLYNRALNPSEINALAKGNPATGSGKLTLGSALAVNGNLILNGSTLDVSASNNNISLKGNFQNAGDFIKRSGTMNLTGTSSQTLSGSTIWNNLAKTVSAAQTLFFDYTSRQSASGALTLRGLSANLLSIRSTRTGSGARVLLDGDIGTQTIDYLDVKDSDARGGQELNCFISSEGCVNSGNNFNWRFAQSVGTMNGYAWYDLNGNGIKAASEQNGLNGLTVSVTGTTMTGASFSASTTTSGTGAFTLQAPVSNPSGYTVTLNGNATPAGYIRTRFNSSGSNVLGTGSTLSVNFGYVLPSTGSGKVYIDANDNGRRDAGETSGIAGVTTTVLGTTATGGTVNRSMTTSSTGAYVFTYLAPTAGSYTFGVNTGTVPTGYSPTSFTNTGVTISQGDSHVSANFGYFWYGTMSGTLFIDANRNGTKDLAETAGYSGATISLSGTTASGGSISLTTRTTSTGAFRFSNVPYATVPYSLSFTTPSGFELTTASAFNRSVSIGQNAPSSLFGIYRLTGYGTLNAFVWNDTNGNGVNDIAETTGLSGIAVAVSGTTATGTVINRNLTTDGAGQISVSLPVSTSAGYTVTLNGNATPAGYIRTRFNSSGSNLLGTGGTVSVKFGYALPSTASGRVFIDLNANGRLDGNETQGIAGVTATILGTTGTGGTLLLSHTTSGNGSYAFSGLAPSLGQYTVGVNTGTVPAGYRATSATNSGLTVTSASAPVFSVGYLWYATMTGSVFNDTNNNGTHDVSETAGVAGATVTMTGLTTTGASINLSVQSSATGSFAFPNLPIGSGSYAVSIVTPSGFQATTVTSVNRSITAGQVPASVAFGMHRLAGTGIIAGTVWNDINGNAVYDNSETGGLAGIGLLLTGRTSTGFVVNRAATTVANGAYSYSLLISSSTGYSLAVNGGNAPSGYIRTRGNSSGNLVLGTGATITANFGYVQASTLSGTVFLDLNEDGHKNASELYVFSGSTLHLTGTTGTGGTMDMYTTSNASGAYLFTGLPTSIGSFLLTVDPPAGHVTTTTSSRSVAIATGDSHKAEDFGFIVYVAPAAAGAGGGNTDTGGSGPTGGGKRPYTAIVIQIEKPDVPPPGVLPGTGTTPPASAPVIVPGRDETVKNLTLQLEQQLRADRLLRRGIPDFILGNEPAVVPAQDQVNAVQNRVLDGVLRVSGVVTVPVQKIGNLLAAVGNTLRDTWILSAQTAGHLWNAAGNGVDASGRLASTAIASAEQSVGGTIASAWQWSSAYVAQPAGRTFVAVAMTIGNVVDGTGRAVMNAGANMGSKVALVDYGGFGSSVAQAVSGGILNPTNRGAIAFVQAIYGTAHQIQTAGTVLSRVASLDYTPYSNGANIWILRNVVVPVSRTSIALLQTVQNGVNTTATTAHTIASDTASVTGYAWQQRMQQIHTHISFSSGQAAGRVASAGMWTVDTFIIPVETSVVAGEHAIASAFIGTRNAGVQLASAFINSGRNAGRTVRTSVAAAGTNIFTGATDTLNTASRRAAIAYVTVEQGTSLAWQNSSAGVQLFMSRLRVKPAPQTQIARKPDTEAGAKKYRTALYKKDNKVVIASLSMEVLNSLGNPYSNTPVVLFSTPKIAMTNEGGIATFHEVETGAHKLEIHVEGEKVQTRDIIIEPPSNLTLEDQKRVDVVLPVISVLVQNNTPSAWNLPPAVWVALGMLFAGNIGWGYIVWKGKRKMPV